MYLGVITLLACLSGYLTCLQKTHLLLPAQTIIQELDRLLPVTNCLRLYPGTKPLDAKAPVLARRPQPPDVVRNVQKRMDRIGTERQILYVILVIQSVEQSDQNEG